jgi:hypothetical protein
MWQFRLLPAFWTGNWLLSFVCLRLLEFPPFLYESIPVACMRIYIINKIEPCVHQKFDWRKLGFALKVRVEREVELPV